MCASFEVLCFVHPLRCFVMCILRGAMFCASFEIPCCVHPLRCFDVGCARGVSRKTSPPFLAHGSSRFFFEGLLGNVGLGDTRGDFVFGEKHLPPCQRVVPEERFEGYFLQGQVPFGKNWSALSMRNVSAFCWMPDVSFEK